MLTIESKFQTVRQDFAFCCNTKHLMIDVCGDTFYFISLGEQPAYRVISALANDKFFGMWDTRGVLHPTLDSTQWNWSRRGLWLTCFYKQPSSEGIARVYAMIRGQDTLRRFLELIKWKWYYGIKGSYI